MLLHCRRDLDKTPLKQWAEPLIKALALREDALLHGEFARWRAAVDALPVLDVAEIDLNHEDWCKRCLQGHRLQHTATSTQPATGPHALA